LRIVNDQHGAPTWCRTIADATAHAVARLSRPGSGIGLDQDLLRALSGVYHLAAQGQTTWHGFAQTIVAHKSTNKKPAVLPINTQDYPLPARRPANSVLSCERLTGTFCGLPKWDEALRLCLD
jgi:dTDP-4-dehydrorhamnose reductase